jgi:cytochrome c oxidase cbb3-type subunit 3
MAETPSDHLLDHEYDGIREYDNPPPAWWSWIYFGTIVFSIIYFFFFQFSPVAWTNDDLYQASVAANLRQQFSEIGDLTPDRATIVSYMSKPEWLTVGESVFKSQCAQCHAPDGHGLVGPNLTDDKYINVQNIEDIAKVINEGANNGAMPAWQARLHVNEVVLTAAYVASLRGQNLEGPGIDFPNEKEIPPWPAASNPAAETEATAEK